MAPQVPRPLSTSVSSHPQGVYSPTFVGQWEQTSCRSVMRNRGANTSQWCRPWSVLRWALSRHGEPRCLLRDSLPTASGAGEKSGIIFPQTAPSFTIEAFDPQGASSRLGSSLPPCPHAPSSAMPTAAEGVSPESHDWPHCAQHLG